MQAYWRDLLNNNEFPSTAFFLCAGVGSRFAPYTQNAAKPSIPFLGLPLGLHPLLHCPSGALSTIVFNSHHQPTSLVQAFERYFPEIEKIEVHESQLLGSGGGIRNASNHFQTNADVLVANGDEIFLCEQSQWAQEFYRAHKQSGASMTLLCTEHAEAGGKFGAIWLDSDNQVITFGRRAAVRNNAQLFPKHFLGYILLNTAIIDQMPDGDFNILYDFAVKLLARDCKSVQAYQIKADWFETGNINDFQFATEQVLKAATLGRYAHWFQRLRQSQLPE